ncbi:MAG TPA: nucleoside triphosphate pyrophosphohydrolase [Chloroflexi bacterium]|nr:nucleoside triphosphate pyrophosphohydrolase [Chloroflexota bacterium]
MRIAYDKLVRDRIPEVIRTSGRRCGTRVLEEEEYRTALRQKLVEEAREAARAGPEELAGELVDILELIDALLAAEGIDAAAVGELRARKREERGGFEERICLLWTE